MAPAPTWAPGQHDRALDGALAAASTSAISDRRVLDGGAGADRRPTAHRRLGRPGAVDEVELRLAGSGSGVPASIQYASDW